MIPVRALGEETMRNLSGDVSRTFTDPVLIVSRSRKPGAGNTANSLPLGSELCGSVAGLATSGSGDDHVT